jgi:uncharacterized protein (TIGR02594 family)
MSQAIFDHALKDIGVSEIIGPKSHPRISLAIKSSANWLPISDGDVPWCGCIRGLWGLETGTGVPAAHYRAASWAKWGKAVPLDPAQWRKGDTVVMGRAGGNHVALFSHIKGERVFCLGGNQSDSVSLTSFSISGIWAVRR